jgi:hypothetical protein
VVRMSRHGDDPELVGAEVAHALLVEGGGSGIEGFEDAVLEGFHEATLPGRCSPEQE